MTSIYSFERSELRVMQIMCEGDNEKFLNMLADLVGGQAEQIRRLKEERQGWTPMNCPCVDRCHRID